MHFVYKSISSNIKIIKIHNFNIIRLKFLYIIFRNTSINSQISYSFLFHNMFLYIRH
ncbi:hypothetical protein GLOIN_2v760390 [Rhizophagus irregularis DAOM 181602=DAOM 197198]|uniref:Uncharacterized protein n=1 Tax=Rhizophagus irregularis (strain DAOM 181602 / DAOM 197198 / MUCL 43194) TaxID=747089 RepID=A0A2P4QJ77_RHIID|nr:hypothetical protein GLOIN_2v760390 [Rhizophagus irregularis DAOM 181602=DAOM 197198]POG77707.1 hypothetical protein GLOIN_2v760390 [Rhizophagus irregularis DAOM 181602=DAOM 197198]|eukprot:XP_025184573.1 hypothetical protein GLOIN_2v760390 [Rhizophagus irregularis DAOM 181602=DAOM 197198]